MPLVKVILAKSHLENPRSRWQGSKSQNRSSVDGVADCPSSLKKYVDACMLVCIHVNIIFVCRYRSHIYLHVQIHNMYIVFLCIYIYVLFTL